MMIDSDFKNLCFYFHSNNKKGEKKKLGEEKDWRPMFKVHLGRKASNQTVFFLFHSVVVF
jgi:hypothetical protein